MKHALSILLCSVAIATAALYSDKVLDEVDPEPIVTNTKTLKEYVDCFLDKQDCNSLAARAKRIIQDAIMTACEKCPPAMKQKAKRFYDELEVRLPEEYEELKKKYDPNGEYFQKLYEAIGKV